MVCPAEDRLFRAEDLYRLPDDVLRYELARGRLVSEPPAGVRHGQLSVRIAYALETYARKSGAGVVLTAEAAFILARNPDTVRAPDVSYITRERYVAVLDKTRFMSGPPDLAVEVLSPSNRPALVHEKIADYLEAGTSLVWVCDPELQTMQVFPPRGGATFRHDEVLTARDLLPGFRLALRELFEPVV